jgi:hypothetical protein
MNAQCSLVHGRIGGISLNYQAPPNFVTDGHIIVTSMTDIDKNFWTPSH